MRPSIDKEIALERVEGDEELLAELAVLFLEQIPTLSKEMRDSMAAKDAVTLHRAAHSLKGSAANVGAQPTFELSAELEALAKNQRFDEAGVVLGKLEVELVSLTSALTALSGG